MAEPLRSVLMQSQQVGHLGPPPIEHQIAHSRAFRSACDMDSVATWCDLGTGGGLPGLVLAADLPDTRGTLVEVRRLRAKFLRDALREIGATQVEVVERRAEEVAHDPAYRGRFDLVTARAFAKPSTTAECGIPLVGEGGQLVVSDPPGGEARWPSHIPELKATATPVEVDGFHFTILRRTGPVAARYPRRPSPMSKRPLFSTP